MEVACRRRKGDSEGVVLMTFNWCGSGSHAALAACFDCLVASYRSGLVYMYSSFPVNDFPSILLFKCFSHPSPSHCRRHL